MIDEIGWQTDTNGMSQYVNPENVRVISEQTQANYLKTLVTKYFACDPAVVGVQLFLLADEKYRNGHDESGKYIGGGWQSGLLTAGGQGVSQPKKSYTQLAPLFAEGRAACAGSMINWTPGRTVASGKTPRKPAPKPKKLKAKLKH